MTRLGAQAAALEKQVAAAGTPAAAALPAGGATASAALADVKLELAAAKQRMSAAKLGTGESNVFRGLFFVMTFFTIGLVSNFKKLWEEGIGKLAAVYVISLFGFIIWVGLLISWIFFHGVKPPLMT